MVIKSYINKSMPSVKLLLKIARRSLQNLFTTSIDAYLEEIRGRQG
jgi:hypothetical protein